MGIGNDIAQYNWFDDLLIHDAFEQIVSRTHLCKMKYN